MTVGNFFEAEIDTEIIIYSEEYVYTTDFMGNYDLISKSFVGAEITPVEDFEDFLNDEINFISTVDDVIILSI